MGTGPGQIVDEDDWAYIANRTYDKPIGRISRTTAQALADNTFVAIQFATEDYDNKGYHSTSVNTTRVTPTQAGYYQFRGGGLFEAQTTPTFSDVVLRKNGTDLLPPGARMAGATSAHGTVTFATIDMNGSTDYIELVMRQDSAGADNTNATTPFIPVLEWEFVADL